MNLYPGARNQPSQLSVPLQVPTKHMPQDSFISPGLEQSRSNDKSSSFKKLIFSLLMNSFQFYFYFLNNFREFFYHLGFSAEISNKGNIYRQNIFEKIWFMSSMFNFIVYACLKKKHFILHSLKHPYPL